MLKTLFTIQSSVSILLDCLNTISVLLKNLCFGRIVNSNRKHYIRDKFFFFNCSLSSTFSFCPLASFSTFLKGLNLTDLSIAAYKLFP